MENYQYMLEKELSRINDNGYVPSLLLHSCCAPCSSYVIEYLSNFFNITIYYYNPNISPYEEFQKRALEQINFINAFKTDKPVKYVIEEYDNDSFNNMVKGLEHLEEGGHRCFKCYEMRLKQTCIYAKKNNFDYFCSTLTVSPYKNANKLNEIGINLEKQYNIKYLCSDFKKKNGYKRSIELSKLYNLYRQDYCGCIYSKKSRGKNNE